MMSSINVKREELRKQNLADRHIDVYFVNFLKLKSILTEFKESLKRAFETINQLCTR